MNFKNSKWNLNNKFLLRITYNIIYVNGFHTEVTEVKVLPHYTHHFYMHALSCTLCWNYPSKYERSGKANNRLLPVGAQCEAILWSWQNLALSNVCYRPIDESIILLQGPALINRNGKHLSQKCVNHKYAHVRMLDSGHKVFVTGVMNCNECCLKPLHSSPV